jgi:two-component system LytT family response regulator
MGHYGKQPARRRVTVCCNGPREAPELALPRRRGRPEDRGMKIPLKSGSKTFFVDVAAIDWIQAAGNYLVFHIGPERYTVRGVMAAMEEALAPMDFLRIHKSVLVNVDRVKAIEPIHAGDQQVLLHDGTELVMSRTYRGRFDTLFASAWP